MGRLRFLSAAFAATMFVALVAIGPPAAIAADTSPPVTTHDWQFHAPTGTPLVSGPLTVHFSVVDESPTTTHYFVDHAGDIAFAGVGNQVSLGNLPDGGYDLVFWSVDASGNTEDENWIWFIVDNTPPITTVNVDVDEPLHVVLTLSAVDFNSLDGTYGNCDDGLHCTLDDGLEVLGQRVIVVWEPGEHTLVYWSEDPAGNVEGQQTYTFEVTDPLGDNQIRLDDAIAMEDAEYIVEAIVFAFDYLDDPRAQAQIDQGRAAYAALMYERITFARDSGTLEDIPWLQACQSLLQADDPPVMGGGGRAGAYGYLWDACDEAIVEILLRDVRRALDGADFEALLSAQSLVLAGYLSDEAGDQVWAAAQEALNKLVVSDLNQGILERDGARLGNAISLCLAGIVDPATIPGDLYQRALSLYQELLGIQTLSVAAFSPVDVCVIDPLGRRAGVMGGQAYDEIPGATYTGPETSPERVEVPLTEPGSYKVELGATGEGYYRLLIAGLGLSDGERVNTYEGTAQPGATYSYDFELPYVLGDTTPPEASASLAGNAGQGGWYASTVTATITATEEAGGSGVAAIWYGLDGAAPVPAAVLTPPAGGATASAALQIAGEGNHTLTYWAVDVAGNAGPETTTSVKIDTQGPTVTAFPVAAVKRGQTASFRYRVTDKRSPTATATIKVRDLRGRTVATWHAGSVPTGVTQTYRTKISLSRGAYTLEFDAVDLAGNKQSIPGFAVLIVF